MLAGMPKDPVILLSFVNTKLRDYYPSLDVLCEELAIPKEDLSKKLQVIDYEYDATQNQFV